VNIATAWSSTTGDVHGAAAGTGTGGLAPEYKRGNAAIPCGTCHDTHGNSNLYHLRNTINGRTGISATTNNAIGNACYACHTGDASAWHAECNGCHNQDHWGGPVIASGAECASCHKHSKKWIHPATCHGCEGGSTYTTF
jgi:hypothetical protein